MIIIKITSLITLLILLTNLSSLQAITFKGGNNGQGSLFFRRLKDFNYFTLSPHVEALGPIHNGSNDQEYLREIFNMTLSIAHDLAAEQIEAKNRESYFTFLMLALIVPLHESRFMHFRANLGKRCSESSNSGKRFFLKTPYTRKKHQIKAYNLFKDIFVDKFIIPDCHLFDKNEDVLQILSSGYSDDMGIMQLNIVYHKDYYLSGNIFNVESNLKYGLKYLYEGFKTATLNFNNKNYYSCLRSSTGKLDNFRLILASWAGKYNSGQPRNSCRFAKKNNPAFRNDQDFRGNALKGLLLRKNGQLHKYLKGIELEALKQIIDTYEQLLFTKYRVINVHKSLNIRNRKKLGDNYKCGKLPLDKEIRVLSIKDGWAHVLDLDIDDNLDKTRSACVSKRTFKHEDKHTGKTVTTTYYYPYQSYYVSAKYLALSTEQTAPSPLFAKDSPIWKATAKGYRSPYREIQRSKQDLTKLRYTLKLREKDSKELNIRLGPFITAKKCGNINKDKLSDKSFTITHTSKKNWVQISADTPGITITREDCRSTSKFYIYSDLLQIVTDSIIRTKKENTRSYRIPKINSALLNIEPLAAGEYYYIESMEDAHKGWYQLATSPASPTEWLYFAPEDDSFELFQMVYE